MANRKTTDEIPIPAELVDEPTEAAPDPFDPAALRLEDSTSFGVKKVLTAVPCDKPNKHSFVRAHPSPDYRMETALFRDEGQGSEHYLVAPALRDALVQDLVPVRLITAITRHGDVFLWPVRLPGADGRSNYWHESMAAAAELAMTKWVRISANMLSGRYDVFEATGAIPEPEWPELSFRDLLKLAFGQRYIDDYDHAILKALRGEV